MTDQAESIENQRWLLEPLGAGEVRVVVAVNEGAQLTPELSDAIERLTEALRQQEVQGYGQNFSLVQLPSVPNAETSVRPGVCRSFRGYRSFSDIGANPGVAGTQPGT